MDTPNVETMSMCIDGPLQDHLFETQYALEGNLAPKSLVTLGEHRYLAVPNKRIPPKDGVFEYVYFGPVGGYPVEG